LRQDDFSEREASRLSQGCSNFSQRNARDDLAPQVFAHLPQLKNRTFRFTSIDDTYEPPQPAELTLDPVTAHRPDGSPQVGPQINITRQPSFQCLPEATLYRWIVARDCHINIRAGSETPRPHQGAK
jgi:hypothetical protein